MLKRFVLGSTALVALASSAFAADLPSRRAPAPYVVVPVFTWTGFYIGANAGYIFSDNGTVSTRGNGPTTTANVAVGARPPTTRLDAEGFTGGGQVGYNYQFGAIVVGIEADAAYTDYQRRRDVTGTTGAVSRFGTDLGYLGTVRGRVGYAFDRLLVFGTGGFAYGDVQNTGTFFATPAAGGNAVVQFAGRRSGIETGYAAGGGIEYALPSNYGLFGSAVTLKAEALYFDLGRKGVVVADTGAAPAAARGQSYTSRFDTSGVIARAGINFKFGSY